jgi:hypothetical protein
MFIIVANVISIMASDAVYLRVGVVGMVGGLCCVDKVEIVIRN